LRAFYFTVKNYNNLVSFNSKKYRITVFLTVEYFCISK